jgi:hypothetical protein
MKAFQVVPDQPSRRYAPLLKRWHVGDVPLPANCVVQKQKLVYVLFLSDVLFDPKCGLEISDKVAVLQEGDAASKDGSRNELE